MISAGGDFLAGGGALGALIRDHDWSSSLGAIPDWPQSLKTATALLLRSPVPMVMLWGEDGIMIYNDAYSVIAGGRHPQLLGSRVREGWPEVADFNDNVMRVGLAGGTLAYRDQELTLHRHGGPEQVWMNLDYSPVLDESGAPAGVIAIVVETTERVETHRKLRESEERLQLAIDAAGAVGTWDYDIRANRVFTDSAFARMFSVDPGVADTGAPLEAFISGIHPDDRDRVAGEIAAVLAKPGEYQSEYRLALQDGGFRWVLARGRIYPDETGAPCRFPGVVMDISDRRAAEEALRHGEDRLRLAIDATGIGIWDYDPVSGRLEWDERVRAAFGVRDGRVIDYALFLAGLHPDDRARTDAAVQGALDPSGGGGYDIEYRTIGIDDGIERWVSARGRGVFEGGQAVRFIGTTLDISVRREADRALFRSEAALREQSQTLTILNETAARLSAELDVGTLVQMVTDAGVELTGAQFGAFFYNDADSDGDSYLLHALSGALPDQFDFGMPRSTLLFRPTFSGEGVVRSDDVTADPRYGSTAPHFGMPNGHLPVVSYLAVPVTSRSGKVIGVLLFGHGERARFTERHEALMVGIAAQAAIAMDNARLYEAAQREIASREAAEQELRTLNDTLEQRVTREVERRTQVEEALLHAQKMETLGQLTGGVAHDFNNLLQIVSGNIEIIQRNLPADIPRLQRAAGNAARGAERAAVLTQRLLAFARRQPLAPKPIEPNRLVSGMSELLHRTLGETVAVETVLAPGLWLAEADPHQLENAIINLAVNARDAMAEEEHGGGGKLTIETSNTHLDRAYAARNREVAPGHYVCICVSDTGGGMDADTVTRAVEPFFTTKDVGKGTGLGLSMVYGFVKQSGGHFKIDSRPGAGTTVKIYLPRLHGGDAAVVAAEEADEADEADEAPAPQAGRNETILACEDDDDVRAFTVEVLRDLGYRVLEAHDAHAALRLLREHREEVDLLFTDVVLPAGMTGAVLAREARALRPDLRILFTTGYARDAIVHHGRLDPGVELITKPFSSTDLAARVRDMLDGAA